MKKTPFFIVVLLVIVGPVWVANTWAAPDAPQLGLPPGQQAFDILAETLTPPPQLSTPEVEPATLLATDTPIPISDAELATPTPVVAEDSPTAQPKIYEGLTWMEFGPCAGLFMVNDTGSCTHGPDEFPDIKPVAGGVLPLSNEELESSPNSIICDGDGVSGHRVQVMYVRASDRLDRYSVYLGSIRQWAAGADAIFAESAAETGGIRHVRFVHDANCTLTVLNVELSATGDDNFANMEIELRNRGYASLARKYMIFMDAEISMGNDLLCGQGSIEPDARPGNENDNNFGPSYGRTDAGCWGDLVPAHELMHNLGGVQRNAPNTNGLGHCIDEYDRMCYSEQGAPPTQHICPTPHDRLFDCNHNDYYHTNPMAGSYLAQNWNSANNSFLIGGYIPQPIPTPPSHPTATALSTSSIRVSWQDNATDELGFKVYKWDGLDFAYLTSVGANVTSYTDSGLDCKTTYSYKVSAYHASGESPRTRAVFATTWDWDCPVSPYAPSNLTATALSTSSIQLNWQDNSGNETGFNIFRSYGRYDVYLTSVGPNVTSYTHSSLPCNTTLSYKVSAYNDYGSSARTNAVSATTWTCPPPNPPINPSATALSASSIRVNWQDNSGNETGFKIYRWNGSAFAYFASVGANATSYTNSSLTCNTTYSYTVSAYNTGGESAQTSPVSATTWACPTPNPPINPSATALSASSIRVNWQDNSGNETGFKIYRWNGSAFAYFASVGANATSYTNSSLTCNTTYSYTVSAYNTGGESAQTSAVSAITWGCPPNPPSNLTATAISTSSIRLSWQDNSSNETGFKIYRWNGSAYALLASVGANITSYTNSGLTCNTPYSYKVSAYNAAGESAQIGPASATTWACPPNPPLNLIATAVATNSIRLNWQDNATNETGFKIYRWNGSAFAHIASVGANITSYTNSKLNCNTPYSYTVSAYNTGGESAQTSPVTATTWACPPPNPPSNPSTTALSAISIRVNWQDNASNETGFKIYRWNGSAFAHIASVGANASSYTNSSLNCNTPYSYTVSAYNTGGESAQTSPASATTWTCQPNPPLNLTATAISTSSIRLNWQDNSDNEVGFKIYKLSGAFYIHVASVGANITNYTDSGLSCLTPYSYKVSAYNTTGESAQTGAASATTWGCPPNAPLNFTATAISTSSIRLNWQDNSGNETGFKIYRWNGSSYVYLVGVGANVTSYTDSGLNCNTPYFYKLTAYNAYGESASGTASAITWDCPPNPPLNPSATALSENSIRVSWQDNSSNETGFKIYRWNGSAYALLASVGANVTSYTNSSLTCNTPYSYKVSAYHTYGESAQIGPASATTWACPTPIPPTAPSNLIATAVSASSIQLSWQDNSSNETGFHIYRFNGSVYAYYTSVGANITSYTNSSLTCNTPYSYKVSAYNATSESAQIGPASATTWVCPTPIPPTAPSNLIATAVSTSSIRLNWQDNSSNETGFHIYRFNGSVYAYYTSVGTNVTSYTDSGLNCSTPYYYKVSAYNATSESAQTNPAYTTTGTCPPPNPPSNLIATPVSETSIRLNWQDNATNETGFKIYRWDGWGYVHIDSVGANVASYTNSGLTCNTAYRYKVSAYNAYDESASTNEASATTFPCSTPTPAAPSNPTATAIAPTRIRVNWQDNSNNEAGFNIYRLDNSVYELRDFVGTNVTSYTDFGLNCNDTYWYYIKAYNASGESAPTNQVFATTPTCDDSPEPNLTDSSLWLSFPQNFGVQPACNNWNYACSPNRNHFAELTSWIAWLSRFS